jgi:hypothetical protein
LALGARGGILTVVTPAAAKTASFSDDVVAAAVIDRLVHHAEVLTLTGDSYRTRQRVARTCSRQYCQRRPRVPVAPRAHDHPN